MPDFLPRLTATFFFIGNVPVAPGSLASFAGAMLAIALHDHPVLYLIFLGGITAAGFAVSGRVEKLMGRKDPGCIVIDEVSGIFVAFFALPLTVPVIITAFFLFRAFDMFKIFPVNKFEQYEGATGIMADDLCAGLYTNIVMHLALRWVGIV